MKDLNVKLKKKDFKIKRKGPKITMATAKKIIANPKTPPPLKKYWKKRFKLK